MHSTPITTGCRARTSHRPPTGPGAHESTPSRRWPPRSACPARPLDIDIDSDIDIDRPALPKAHAARRCPAATSPRPCVLLAARAMDAVLITNPRAPHNRILSESFKQKQKKKNKNGPNTLSHRDLRISVQCRASWQQRGSGSHRITRTRTRASFTHSCLARSLTCASLCAYGSQRCLCLLQVLIVVWGGAIARGNQMPLPAVIRKNLIRGPAYFGAADGRRVMRVNGKVPLASTLQVHEYTSH